MSKNDIAPWSVPFTPVGIRLDSTPPLEIRALEYGYLPRTGKWSYQNVQSPFWRLYFNPTAGGWIESAGRRITLTPRRIVLTPPFVRFDCGTQRICSHFWIHFSLEPQRTSWREPLVVKTTPLLSRLVSAALSGAKRRVQSAPVTAASESLIRMCLAQTPLPSTRFPADSERLNRVLETMSFPASHVCSNRELARLAGMSTEGFIRWFRAQTDATPHDYLVRRRIRESARRLAYTDDTIETISFDLGFPNRHYFTRMFSRHTGMPPARFRAFAAACAQKKHSPKKFPD